MTEIDDERCCMCGSQSEDLVCTVDEYELNLNGDFFFSLFCRKCYNKMRGYG